MTANEELIALAEETRRRAFDIMTRAISEQDPPTDPFDTEAPEQAPLSPCPTAVLAGRLSDCAADVGRQAQMDAEQAEGYELRGLVAATPLTLLA